MTAFWREFRREENKTVIKKFDVCYDVREVEVSSLIGKTAHINILKDVSVIEILLSKMEECFAE